MSLQQIRSLPEEKRYGLYAALESLYRKLDTELGDLPQPCTGCGACCHFSEAEHRLYGSSLELAFLQERHPSPKLHPEDRCPHQVNKKCTVRDERLIGCRTFFRLHSQEDSEASQRLYEAYLGKLKSLYREWGLDWEYRDLMTLYS